MPNPAPTTDYSEVDPKAELTKFFWGRAVNALNESIEHLRDRDYYDEARLKLKSGIDLSDDLPIIKKLTDLQVLTALEALHAESIANIQNAWTLKSGAGKVFNTTIRTHDSEESNIPCFDVEYSAQTDAGTTKVHVKTWRRNIEIDVIGNATATKAASQKLMMAGLK
jgi:hypothetical protein